MNRLFKIIVLSVALLTVTVSRDSFCQVPSQIIKGSVFDNESRAPLPGANIVILNSEPLTGTSTDVNGKFRLVSPIGRISLKVSFLGYSEIILKDILVQTGREVELNIGLSERIISANEVVVTASGNRQMAVNQMAAISTNTVRPDDALRYAGGFYDPSRIVNAFAGVVTANDDESNDIVIRGNSSRGLLWRLEGIEIPNPNHFSDGQGGSGGAYSAITSNVISTFDFFTGAFPAEYGNAMSGVMDLSLRKGNADKYQFALQTGMIGAEASAEGPLSGRHNSSFLFNGRYANFGYLEQLDLIDLGETNWAPRSTDLVLNVNLPSGSKGNFNIFGLYGKSSIGKKAVEDISSWQSDRDRWEEVETIESAVAGIRHLLPFPGGNSYIRSVFAFTWYRSSYNEGFVDSSLVRTNSYMNEFKYPSLRYSVMMNNKISSRTVIRSGASIDFLAAHMKDLRLKNSGIYDTLVAPYGSGFLGQAYIQMKNRFTQRLELNSGIHMTGFSVNQDFVFEPRVGIRWQLNAGNYLTAGAGLHSRAESFPVYYNYISSPLYGKSELNKDLKFAKSFHLVTGADLSAAKDLRVRIEIYNQHLFDVPIIDNPSSRYSSLNTAEDLPSSMLENSGSGYNRGVEFTVDKYYSRNYYFLCTFSLFTSKYRAGDNRWYNTYYNNGYVSNLLAGKDFYFGKEKRNSFSINSKMLLRGGYRYTPVDVVKTLRYRRIVYDINRSYAEQLPAFFRFDAGISYRRNNPGFSWVMMVDVQNITGRHNIFRKRFRYENYNIVETNVYSLGAVPVVNLRIEF